MTDTITGQIDIFGVVHGDYDHQACTAEAVLYSHRVTPRRPDPEDLAMTHWSGYRASEYDTVDELNRYYVEGQKGRHGIPPRDPEWTRELGHPISADATATWDRHMPYRLVPGWRSA